MSNRPSTRRARPRVRKAPPHSSPRDPTTRSPEPQPTPLPRFLTVDETADLLRTTRRAIYTRIQRGDFPGVVRLSRRLLIDADALLHWLDERRGPSPNPKEKTR